MGPIVLLDQNYPYRIVLAHSVAIFLIFITDHRINLALAMRVQAFAQVLLHLFTKHDLPSI